MLIKMLNTGLILFAVFMGIKQGYGMFSGKQELMDLFSKWHFTKSGLIVLGGIGMVSAILILFPKTFIWGNFLMAAGILLIICLHAADRNLKGVLIELPFFLLNLAIIYLQHPLSPVSPPSLNPMP